MVTWNRVINLTKLTRYIIISKRIGTRVRVIWIKPGIFSSLLQTSPFDVLEMLSTFHLMQINAFMCH